MHYAADVMVLVRDGRKEEQDRKVKMENERLMEKYSVRTVQEAREAKALDEKAKAVVKLVGINKEKDRLREL